MSPLQASFFWQNDRPGGIGITFGPPTFQPHELEMMFEGAISKKFIQDSDAALGSNIVNTMLLQLSAISARKGRNEPITSRLAILAALNIMWLSSRGFIPQDEFNGVQLINHLVVAPAPGKPT